MEKPFMKLQQKEIGFDTHKGSIVPGKDAYIIVFDKDINISMVIVKGNMRIQH